MLFDAAYALALGFAAPLLALRAARTGRYRKNVRAKFLGPPRIDNPDGKPVVWFHGVSVGEVHLLSTLVPAFRARHPHLLPVVSSTTDTGLAEAQNRFPDLPVIPWPLDFSWAVNAALKAVNPSLVVLAESELWPNFLARAARRGVPDAVVSNAGFTRAEHLGQVDDAIWASELAINLSGAYAMTDPIVAAMAARGRGSLVFISSVNALAHYGNPAYAAAKAGLIAYAKAIAVERGGQGVRANVVAPGSVRTPAWDHRLAADPTLLNNVLPHYPLGRMVTPAEVANAAVFFCSDAASGITGTVLPVDAGLMAGNLRFVDEVLRGK